MSSAKSHKAVVNLIVSVIICVQHVRSQVPLQNGYARALPLQKGDYVHESELLYNMQTEICRYSCRPICRYLIPSVNSYHIISLPKAKEALAAHHIRVIMPK